MTLALILLVACGETQTGSSNDATPGDAFASGDGGSGDPSGSSWYKSGTRIKMIVLNTPDGAKQFSGWRDTVRNEDCTFVPTGDGMTRCLPTPSATSRYVYSATYFADASCTVPVAQVAASCTSLPSYILTADISDCQTSIVYTAVNMRGTQMYSSAYLKSGASCTGLTANASVVYYGIGAAVPLTEFQTATRAIE